MHAGRGTHFDPRLFDVFMSLLPEMNAIAQSIVDVELDHNLFSPATNLLQVSEPCVRASRDAVHWSRTARTALASAIGVKGFSIKFVSASKTP